MIPIMQYFLLFIIYSFIGWITDIILAFNNNKRIINRGFLIGPYCPIYGIGAISIILLLKKYQHNYIILFCMSLIICSIIEYITSYLMEKKFKLRWWDYSYRPFNINGRVCLSVSIIFAFGGVLITLINKHIFNLINSIPIIILIIISILILIIFITDIIMSFNIISKIKINNSDPHKDYSIEINKKVKTTLNQNSYRLKRLSNAFPKIKQYQKNKI